ncbi:MAG: TlpA family protein disulfide reductase [Bacteroidota bacterium]
MNIIKLSSAIFIISCLFFSCKNKQEVAKISANSESKKFSNQSNEIVYAVEGLNIGNKAPEFSQLSTKGSDLALSSLKGKVVLIDFWASWCGPCRQENPAVVAAYHKYQNLKFKNGNKFEILSVSLDQNKTSWIKAIEKDGLIWENHVCDFLGWNNSIAQRYGVNAIPTNFLINGDGIIIGKALRGQDLENALQNYLK